MSRFPAVIAAILTLGLLAACEPAEPPAETAAGTAQAAAESTGIAGQIAAATATVNEARIIKADSEPGNWLAHGRTYDEQRYSPLKQINADNASELGLAWYMDTGTNRGLEASPIVVDGVMFTTGSWSVVYATNARTGELIWKYDPGVPREWGVYACCDVVNRGAAVWEGTVYSGTIDGRLIALNAATGDLEWEVKTIPEERPYTITGAPRIIKGQVVIGNGGAEYGVRGYITAYDVKTGEQNWRFYTVPGDPSLPFENEAMEKAASTWRGGKWWEVGGGGTVWDSMAYDPELNLLYIGTGNGSPWNRYIRSPGGGDNLYLSSIVAINPDNGEMVWYYQTTPGDNWDYTATQHMILADLEIAGETRQVIMQAPKNGFFYVIDRTNGQFISAEAYVPTTWASHVDPETGRPVETAEGRYAEDAKLVSPAPYGGHNWHPMSYSPDTGLVYIPALELAFMYGQDNAFKYDATGWNTGIDMPLNAPPDDPAEEKELISTMAGHIAAWDPVQQKEVWRVQHPAGWNGGMLSTAGNLIFQGTANGQFAAYRADTGEKVWSAPAQTGIIAPPVTYEVDGEQYVAIMAGWGGAFALAGGSLANDANVRNIGRILAYKIGGKEQLPPMPPPADVPEQPELTASAETLEHGSKLFHLYCATCHGMGAIAGGVIPDLRFMDGDTTAAFDAIVLGGSLKDKGMVSFAHVIDQEGSQAIRQYAVMRSHATRDVWGNSGVGEPQASGGGAQ